VGVTAKDNRLFVEAVLYRYRAGMPWRDLPERFGDFRVVHTRHTRWSKRGVWKRGFERLADDPDNEYAHDRFHHCPRPPAQRWRKRGHQAQEAIGRSKGGLTTKIAATCDARGNPTGFHLTPGQTHDLDGADALLPDIAADTIIADKAFDADERMIQPLQQAGKRLVLPPKSNRAIKRKYDEDLYRARHRIENFFARLKQFRAIATRYDKRAANFLGTLYLAASLTWLN